MKHLYIFLLVGSLSIFSYTTYGQESSNYLELGMTQNKTGNYADALRNFSLEIEKM